MDTNRVTVRYAKALIELANEKQVTDEVDRDLRTVYAALNQYQGFADYVHNPGISSGEKFERIKELFSKDFHDLSMRFLELVFSKNREQYLNDMCRNGIDMIRKLNGIVTSSLSFAREVDAKIADRIHEKFEQKLAVKLEMDTTVESALIGGFVFTIDGLQYDASVATRLKNIKRELQLKS